MTSEKLTPEVLGRPRADIVGQSFLIEGHMRLGGLSGCIDLEPANAGIAVSASALLPKLETSVPCWVGGAYLYDDRVRIIGIIGEREEGLCVVAVTSGVLMREGEGEYAF